MFSKILAGVFKYFVMSFSASMTVYSLYSAFNGGVLGWIFGVAGIAVFEASAMYWQQQSKLGRDGQILVAVVAQWSTMLLSLLSTLVGIALLTEWGEAIQSTLPLGIIMIGLIGAGLAVNMFCFLAFEDEEPEAKRTNQSRKIQAERSKMIYEGDMRALSAARQAMEDKIAAEAPVLGEQLADDGMITVRQHSAPRQLPPPQRNPLPVVGPAYTMGGGYTPPQAPRSPIPQRDGMNARPATPPVPPAVEVTDFYKDDDIDVEHAPLAPKGNPRVTGTRYDVSTSPTRVVRPVPTMDELNRRMNE